MDTFGDDEHTKQLADDTKLQFMKHWKTDAYSSLPEVCDSGKTCRIEIKDAIATSVKEEWKDTLSAIQKKLTGVVTRS